MHKDYLEFIDAYYYLIIVAYFVNYLKFKKVKSYVTKVYGLIEWKTLSISCLIARPRSVAALVATRPAALGPTTA
jgi:hypothetical protein